MIYHSPTKFHPNGTTHGKVMTSYRLIKLEKLLPYRVGNPPPVFTALHAMQTRSSDENSVCLSVCLSVRHTRGL